MAGFAVTGGTANAVAATGGQLEVEAAPTQANLTEGTVLTVRVANTGDGPVRGVGVTVKGPPGVAATVDPATLDTLAAGSSVLVTIRTHGVPERLPAHLVVQATGDADGGETAALTAVELVPAEVPASLTLTGNTRISDASPADVVAVVANESDVPAQVTVRAVAGRHPVRLAVEGTDVTEAQPNTPLELTVPPRQSRAVFVEVRADRPLRRGTTALVVTATVRTSPDAAPADISATRDLEVVLSADLLPGLLGVPTALAVPGLVAIWAGLSVYQWDRRRIGLEQSPPSKQIWDNKLWLLAAGAVGLVGASVPAAAGGFVDVLDTPTLRVLDTPTLRGIGTLTIVLGVLAAMGTRVAVWWHRRRVPAVSPTAGPLDVLTAAERADGGLLRPVYRHDGKLGLWVHDDGDAVVLTPPVEYTEIDNIPFGKKAAAGDSLEQALRTIESTSGAARRLRLASDSAFIDGPRAVQGAALSGGERQAILRYVNAF